MAVINFPNSPRPSHGGIDGNLALDNQSSPESQEQFNIEEGPSFGSQLGIKGQLNQRPEYRQNGNFEGEDMGPIGQKNREARMAQDQETKNKNTESQQEEDAKLEQESKITPAQKKARLTTYGRYKLAWDYLIPLRGLAFLYLIFHFCAKYLAGSQNYCHFIQTTNPVLAMKEIEHGKDVRDDIVVGKFALIFVLIVAILAILFILIFWLVSFMSDPSDAFKPIIGLAKDLIKELWEFFKASMTGPDNAAPSNWDPTFNL